MGAKRTRGLWLVGLLLAAVAPAESPATATLTGRVDDYYPSRLLGEPEGGVADFHFHPTAPRSARIAVVYGF